MVKMDTEVGSTKEFGGSLPVENVQALASSHLGDIPQRYIRPELQSDELFIDASLQIPVIDMTKLLDYDDDEEEFTKLHMACRDWGFFQLINHGVSEQVIEKMKIDSQEFFKLPLEEKMACAQLPNSIEGYGQAFVVSQDQKLDWGDMLFYLAQPASMKNLKIWPTNPASFRASLEEYSWELEKVKSCLLKSMARNLGLESGELASLFEDGVQGVRMNYYPPCKEANRVMGLTKHSDATGLTILVQVNRVEGLQINKIGKWVPVKPLPGAFIINVGDVMEIMSNGEYKSIEHRAVVNPEKERLSIAAFHSPNMKTTMIGPLRDLVKGKANYKTVTHEEYVRLVVTTQLDGKSLLNRMKLEP